MDNKIHIGLSTDDNYVDFAMIVIRSVARFHPQNGKPLVFHIFTNGLSEGQRKRFSRYSSSQVEIKEIPVDTTAFHARWGTAKPMYYRLEYANFLPDLARIIYLDCDVVVLDDIEKLWNMDLQGKPLAGVGDRAGLQEKRKCYCPGHIMFNSGVMLLDLDQWRMEGHVEKLAKFWHDNRSWMHFADQGLLNAYFGRNYTMLPQNLEYHKLCLPQPRRPRDVHRRGSAGRHPESWNRPLYRPPQAMAFLEELPPPLRIHFLPLCAGYAHRILEKGKILVETTSARMVCRLPQKTPLGKKGHQDNTLVMPGCRPLTH